MEDYKIDVDAKIAMMLTNTSVNFDAEEDEE